MAIRYYYRIKLCRKRLGGPQITPRHDPFGMWVLCLQLHVQNQRLKPYQRQQLLRILVEILFHNLVGWEQ